MRRNLPLASLLVLSLLLGIGVSRLRGPSVAPLRETLTPSSPSGSTAAAPEVGPEAPAPTPEEQAVELAALLEAHAPTEYAGGEGAVTGIVRTPAGIPVEGVRVDAVIWGETPGTDPVPIREATLHRYIQQEIEQYHYDRAMMRSGVTDAEGRFEIRGLTDAEYHLHADHDHHWIQGSPGTDTQHVKAGDSVTFFAYPTAPITVKLSYPDGRVPPSAWIEARVGRDGDRLTGGWFRQAWLPDAPTVPIGLEYPYYQAFTYDDHASQIVELRPEQGEPHTLTLVLRPRLGVVVQVRFPDVSFARSAHLFWKKLEPGEEIPAGGTPPMEAIALSKKVERSQPIVSIPDLGPGRYWFGVGYEFSIEVGEMVTVAEAPVTLELALPEIDPAEYATVDVRGPDGRRLRGIGFELGEVYAEEEPPTSGVPLASCRQEDGSYLIWHGKSRDPVDSAYYRYRDLIDGTDEEIRAEVDELFEGPESGSYLIVNSPQYGIQSLPFDRDAGSLTVDFEAAAWAEIHVEAPPELLFRLTLAGPPGTDDAHAPTGPVRVGPLVPGTHSFRLHLGVQFSHNHGTRLLHHEEFVLAPGENRITLATPPLSELIVRFAEEHVGQEIYLASNDGASAGFLRVPGSREVRFDHLPDGSYRLVLTSAVDGTHEMGVEIPRDRDIAFEPRVMNALEITADPAGELLGTGLEVGDLVVGLEGASFSSHHGMTLALMRLAVMDEAEIQIERAGAVVTFTVDGRSLSRTGAWTTLEPRSR